MRLRDPAEHRYPAKRRYRSACALRGERHTPTSQLDRFIDNGNDRGTLDKGDTAAVQVVPAGAPSVSCSDDGTISLPPARQHLASGGTAIRTKEGPNQRDPLDEEASRPDYS